MKYTTVYVQQLKDRKGKPWQARAKYKDPLGKWKEISKMLPEAKGIREAKRMASEWLDELNAQADLMPNAGKQKTLDKVYREYLKHQLDTSEIETYAVTQTPYANDKNAFFFSPFNFSIIVSLSSGTSSHVPVASS